MTQTDPSPSLTVAAQQQAPVTEADLWARICARASVILELPPNKQLRFGSFALGHLFVFWKGEPQADGSIPARGVTVYERGKPAPIKPSLGIMAIFGASDDYVRVYAIPIDPNGGDAGPARITLSRTDPVPSGFVEYMPWNQYIELIAFEIVNEVSDEEPDEEEGEEGEDGEEDGGNGFTPT